jgi:hypothetical protein
MIGPAIGGVVYEYSGYVGTFIVFSGMILLGLMFSYFIIPNSLNNSTAFTSVSHDEIEPENLDDSEKEAS